MRNRRSHWFLVLISTLQLASLQGQSQRLVFRNATLVDGSGSPSFRADVSIREGTIEAVGQIEPEEEDGIVPADGLVLAPGFIDIHNHSRDGLLREPQALSQVSQGITTLIIGADGGSPFPLSEYRRKLEEGGSAVNVGLLVGHGTLRRIILGEDANRPATPDEVSALVGLVRLAMRQGAFGLSSGLEYDPGFYSDTAELVAMAREAAAHGGFYMTHMRDEEDGFLEALEEAIEIGRQASVPVQISHIKLGNKRVWGKTEEVFRRFAQAEAEGIALTADCYPYQAWASGLSILVPSRRFEDRREIRDSFEKIGGAQNVLVTNYPPNPEYEFKTLQEIAAARGIEPEDLFIEMMSAGGAGIVGASMNPDDVDAFYRHPRVMVASDGGIDSRHPRKSGTFPRVLGRFVRERGLLSIEEAVLKMTSMPARRLGLGDRGRIRPGQRADLTLFDPVAVRDSSDFQNPDRLSQGIRMVLVNGIAVWKEGGTTGQLPGQVLRRANSQD